MKDNENCPINVKNLLLKLETPNVLPFAASHDFFLKSKNRFLISKQMLTLKREGRKKSLICMAHLSNSALAPWQVIPRGQEQNFWWLQTATNIEITYNYNPLKKHIKFLNILKYYIFFSKQEMSVDKVYKINWHSELKTGASAQPFQCGNQTSKTCMRTRRIADLSTYQHKISVIFCHYNLLYI